MSRKWLVNRLKELERANAMKAEPFRGVLIVPYAVEQRGPKAVGAWMRVHGFKSAVMLPDVRPRDDGNDDS